MGFLATWALRLGLTLAAGYAVYYVYDVFASAFRERAEFREKYEAATKSLTDETAAREAANATIERQSAAIQAELRARDEAAANDAKRAAEITGKLKNAQRKIAQWEAAAEPELARCLRLPLPAWLLDGADQVDHAAIPGVAAVLQGEAARKPAGPRDDARR